MQAGCCRLPFPRGGATHDPLLAALLSRVGWGSKYSHNLSSGSSRKPCGQGSQSSSAFPCGHGAQANCSCARQGPETSLSLHGQRSILFEEFCV